MMNIILLALAYGLQGDEHVENSNHLGGVNTSLKCQDEEPEPVAAGLQGDAHKDKHVAGAQLGQAGALLAWTDDLRAQSALLEQAATDESTRATTRVCTPDPDRKKNIPPAGEAPILLITLGPTGSGKSGLMKKAAEHLNKTIDDFGVFLVDDYIEKDEKYKENVDGIIRKFGLAVMNGDTIGSKLTDRGRRKLTSPGDDLLKGFTDAYFEVRGKTGCGRPGGCGEQFDCDLEEALKGKENIIFESTGEKLSTINWLISDIGWTPVMNAKALGYKVVVAASMVNFCTLVERNSLRAVKSIEHYLKDRKGNPALRLPNVLDNPSQSRFRNTVSTIRDNVYDLYRGCREEGASVPCPLKDWDAAKDKILVFHNNGAELMGPLPKLSMATDFSIPPACVRFCQEPVAAPKDRVSVSFRIRTAYDAEPEESDSRASVVLPSDGGDSAQLGTTVELDDGKQLQFYFPSEVTLPEDVRPALKIPKDSTHFAYVLPCSKSTDSSSANCGFPEGGFIYFKNGQLQRVNKLVPMGDEEAQAGDGLLELGPLVPLRELIGPAKEFSAHFAAVGAPVGPSRTELKQFGYRESLWVGPGITDEMPHGGFLHACYEKNDCECQASPAVQVERYKDYLKGILTPASVERIGHGLAPTEQDVKGKGRKGGLGLNIGLKMFSRAKVRNAPTVN